MNAITEPLPGWERGSFAGCGGEQSRGRYPDGEGVVERDGQRLFYEVYGEGDETVFLIPTWSLVHSRHWKMQIPYFARHFRVLAMDGLGNGRSDRCRDPERYGPLEFARDCLAVSSCSSLRGSRLSAWPVRRSSVRCFRTRFRTGRSCWIRASRRCSRSPASTAGGGG